MLLKRVILIKNNDIKWYNLFKSLRLSLTIPVVLQLVVGVLFIGIVQIKGVNQLSQSLFAKLHEQITLMIDQSIETHLSGAEKLNQIHINSWNTNELNKNLIETNQKYFVNHLKAFPDAAMTFIGFEDGSFYGARQLQDHTYQIVRNNKITQGASWYYSLDEQMEMLEVVNIYPHFDPRQRPWYIQAKDSGGLVWSQIYSHFVFKEPTITASYPVYQENELIGVFAVDYLLSWLYDTLKTVPIGESGHIFITDERGYLIASSSQQNVYRFKERTTELIKAQDSEHALTAFVAKKISEEDNLLSKVKFDKNTYFIRHHIFKSFGLNWKVYILIASQDYTKQIQQAFKHSLLLVILISIGFLILTMQIGNWITKPILQLNHIAKQIIRGKLMLLEEDDRRDELGELKHSFNQMTRQLTQLVIHLEDQVQARTKELEEKNKELYELSFFDSLTGIANRRFFDHTFKLVWDRAMHQHNPIALVMIDVDYFKKYNDTYGHQMGDRCLEQIGKVLANSTNEEGRWATRFGGEEFMIILENVLIQDIDTFAESIKNGIEALAIEHSESPYGKITVSVGVAITIPDIDQNIEEFILVTDQSLYVAKNSGRNTIQKIII